MRKLDAIARHVIPLHRSARTTRSLFISSRTTTSRTMSSTTPSSSTPSSATPKPGSRYDLIVIGAGSGGLAAAKRASSKYGKSVLICENAYIGGTCVTVGCVPKKCLHAVAAFRHRALAAEREGWHITSQSGSGINSTPLHAAVAQNFGETMRTVREYVARLNAVHTGNLNKARVDIVRGTASFVSKNRISVKRMHDANDVKWSPVTKSSDEYYLNTDPNNCPIVVGEYTGDKIIIATGSSAARLPVPGADELCATSLEFFLDWHRLPKRVCIFGGGYIGVEIASILNAFGCEVELVIRRDLILRGFDDDLRRHLQQMLIKRGIKITTNAEPEWFEKVAGEEPISSADGFHWEPKAFSKSTGASRGGAPATKVRVQFRDGLAKEYDAVLQAVGRTANTKHLNCPAAGVALNQRTASGGVCVHSWQDCWQEEESATAPRKILYGSTTNSDVFALGDVNDMIQLTPVAIAQARQLVDWLYGKNDFPISQRSFQMLSSAIFALPECGTCGLSEELAAKEYGKENIVCRELSFPPLEQFALKPEEKEKAFIKLVFRKPRDGQSEDDMELLGAHICTEAAAEIIQALGIGMQKGISKRDLDLTMALHPSVMEEIVTIY